MTHDFETIRRMAGHLGNTLRDLEPVLGEEQDNWKWIGHRHRCLGIAEAIDIIACAPNAAVTQEVLAAFDKRLEEAHKDLADWCENLLNPQPPSKDEIPF